MVLQTCLTVFRNMYDSSIDEYDSSDKIIRIKPSNMLQSFAYKMCKTVLLTVIQAWHYDGFGRYNVFFAFTVISARCNVLHFVFYAPTQTPICVLPTILWRIFIRFISMKLAHLKCFGISMKKSNISKGVSIRLKYLLNVNSWACTWVWNI